MEVETASAGFWVRSIDMGWLKVLRGNQEEKYSWSPESPSEIQAAQDKFDQYIKRGFIACKIIDQGKRGIPLTKFDREAEEIFMLELADGG